MSRSYKKPYITDGPNGWAKKLASRVVRRFKDEIANGKAYRKLYNPYNIRDWSFWSEDKKDTRK